MSDNETPDTPKPEEPKGSLVLGIIAAIFLPFEKISNVYKWAVDGLRSVLYTTDESDHRGFPARLAHAVLGLSTFIGGSILGGFIFVGAKVAFGPFALLKGIAYLWAILVTGRTVSKASHKKSKKQRQKAKARSSSAPPADEGEH